MPIQPWHELPGEIETAVQPQIDAVTDEIIDAVRTVPAYARPLDGEFGDGIRARDLSPTSTFGDRLDDPDARFWLEAALRIGAHAGGPLGRRSPASP